MSQDLNLTSESDRFTVQIGLNTMRRAKRADVGRVLFLAASVVLLCALPASPQAVSAKFRNLCKYPASSRHTAASRPCATARIPLARAAHWRRAAQSAYCRRAFDIYWAGFPGQAGRHMGYIEPLTGT